MACEHGNRRHRGAQPDEARQSQQHNVKQQPALLYRFNHFLTFVRTIKRPLVAQRESVASSQFLLYLVILFPTNLSALVSEPQLLQ